MPFDTLIKNGTVVTATDTYIADIAIVDGKIHSIGKNLPQENAGKVIDSVGKLVMPGGIDVHTHLDMPFGGTTSADDFETGTRAAAFGGTTTLIDFAIQYKGQTLRTAFDTWMQKAESKAVADYSFHCIITDLPDARIEEMSQLIREGVTSFKLFMAYPGVFYSTDGEILQAMQRASGNGGTIMMHAENGIAIDVLVAQALARGETDPRFHGVSRPSILEGEATHRAIQLARVAGAPVYFVHLSASEALAEVVTARDRGQNVFAETCPQYLFLSDEDLAREGFEGAKYVCSPPLRPREHQAELWRGLRTDDLSVVSTDHCPFCFKEQKELGRGDFSKIPNGLPGVEHRVDLIYQGVVNGEISLGRWVEIVATTPAKMFGLYPTKGVIAPGADADVVVYDPNGRHTLSAATHHMDVDYSVYEGRDVPGKATTVLSRGSVVVDNDQYVGTPGAGRFLTRGLNGLLR